MGLHQPSIIPSVCGGSTVMLAMLAQRGPTCRYPFGFCVSCIFFHLLIELILLICKRASDVSEGQLLKDPRFQVPEGFLGWDYLTQSPRHGRHR